MELLILESVTSRPKTTCVVETEGSGLTDCHSLDLCRRVAAITCITAETQQLSQPRPNSSHPGQVPHHSSPHRLRDLGGIKTAPRRASNSVSVIVRYRLTSRTKVARGARVRVRYHFLRWPVWPTEYTTDLRLTYSWIGSIPAQNSGEIGRAHV